MRLLTAMLFLAGAMRASTIGNPPSSYNCFPFGCGPDTGPGTRYQQVYDADQFSGPITISTIKFFKSTSASELLNAGTFTFSLSTSSNPVNGLDTVNFDSNVGPDNQLFGVFTLPTGLPGGVAPAVLSFSGTPFFYNPAHGPLLLDIVVSIASGGNASYDGRDDDSSGIFSRAHDFGTGFEGFGLVTEFTDVPEPMTGALMGIALGALALVRPRARGTIPPCEDHQS